MLCYLLAHKHVYGDLLSSLMYPWIQLKVILKYHTLLNLLKWAICRNMHWHTRTYIHWGWFMFNCRTTGDGSKVLWSIFKPFYASTLTCISIVCLHEKATVLFVEIISQIKKKVPIFQHIRIKSVQACPPVGALSALYKKIRHRVS